MSDFNQRYAEISVWRRQPYRLFFPTGLVLAWWGVLHWVLHAAGWLPDYRSIFHAIAQIQGFMTCLALGFLTTMIPRRTVTPPPTTWEMTGALLLPVATTAAAWFGRLALSQACWIALVVILITFVLRRFRRSETGRRAPNSFVWIPIAFAMGTVGSLCTSAPGLLGDDYFWLHQLGRLLLLQGFLLGLIAGVGGMALPLITQGKAPPDPGATSRDRLARLAHLGAALLLVASFWLELVWSARVGLALRALVMTLVLVFGAGIVRTPQREGWQRWLVWIGAWMVPLGYWIAAFFPEQKTAGLHVVFIGGFALMGLSVAMHVTLAHGPQPDLVFRRLRPVALFGALLLVSAILRSLVDFDPERFFVWIGWAGIVFLLGTISWAALALPSCYRERS